MTAKLHLKAIHFLVLLMSLLPLTTAGLYADDGIPDNCESANALYYQPNAFPRYEPPGSRVVLVDWVTGADIRELETGLSTSNFQVRGWSSDCQYMIGAVGASDDMDTVVWDAVNGGRVGTVENAIGRPHNFRWSPDNTALVVETRNGAVYWNLVTRTQTLLTPIWDAWTLRNFRSISWDYERGWLDTYAVDGTRLVYQLSDAQPVTNYNAVLQAESGVVITPTTSNCRTVQSSYYSPVTNYSVNYDQAKKRVIL